MAVVGGFRVQLLGETRVFRDRVARPLPRSRKTRGLLAYLALTPRPSTREALCSLIWSDPSDPRAALRWSLSKLRAALSDDCGSALSIEHERITLDPQRVLVDVHEIRHALEEPGAGLTRDVLEGYETELAAGYLVGLDDVGGVEFSLWLQSERDSIRTLHGRVIDALIAVRRGTSAEALPLARRRVALDPSCTPANLMLLQLSLATGGETQAQATLGQIRAHYRAERLNDRELEAGWQRLHGASLGAATEPVPLPLPEKPSIAVLGFREIGAHEAGDVLAYGLAEDLSCRLGRQPQLFVIARQSALRFAGRPLSAREIGLQLGARYLVDGSTQRDGARLRVVVSLIDALRDVEIWGDQIDRRVDDLFAVQDDIVDAVIASILPALERAEMERSRLVAPDSLTAWECYYRGLWHCYRFTRQGNELALRMFERAAELDPGFARAYSGLSFAHHQRAFLVLTPELVAENARALELARKSVDCDPCDAMGHWALARALFFSNQHEDALEAIGRALAIAPNYAQGHYAHGLIGVHAGCDTAALVATERAERLSPFDPLLYAMMGVRAIALANQREYEQAARWAVRATQQPNSHFHIHAIAAACLELAGRRDEARTHAQLLLRERPDYSVESFQRSFPHRDESWREPTLAALARAGVRRADRAAGGRISTPPTTPTQRRRWQVGS